MLMFIMQAGGGLLMILYGEYLLALATFLNFFFFFFEYLITEESFLFVSSAMSRALVILSAWIIEMSLFGSHVIYGKKEHFFLLMLSVLFFLLLLCFFLRDFLFFYFSFECALIPVLFLIMGFGAQPERIQAGMYMLFYTMAAAIPLLLLVMGIYWPNQGGQLFFTFYCGGYAFFYYFFFMLAFLVKFPMYLLHIWLPKAHVEAPVAGSMVLAGVLLKLGGYGLIRVMPLIKVKVSVMQDFFFSVSLWGGLVTGILCLVQMDIKIIIAYSSVVHMSMCILGLMVGGDWGLKGCIIMMVAHGLCSSGLFYLANVIYVRTGSRSLFISKGALNMMPSMALWWFLLLSTNMSAPPSLNLLGELNLVVSALAWEWSGSVIMLFLCFFSAAYSIYLFSLSQHGDSLSSPMMTHQGSLCEYLLCGLHWGPVNLLILGAGFFV